jgi:hypothetical protein
MKFLSKMFNKLYQPVAWFMIGLAMLFCVWGMVDDFNIGCYHSAWRLLWFFLIVLSPLFFALLFFNPEKEQAK